MAAKWISFALLPWSGASPSSRKALVSLARLGTPTCSVTATVEDRVPPFKKNSGEGWLTAEYLDAATVGS